MTAAVARAERHARPLVSIITPSLQQVGWIEQAILSVRAQTYDNIEHIVIDGGSTDGTLEVLARHQAASGLTWVSEPDGGMYEAVNKGMDRARGDILAYLNSDDLYFPWTIAAVVEAFAADPAADVIFGDAFSVDDRSGRAEALVHAPFNLDWLRRVGFLAQPAVFWRRRVLERFGAFDESLTLVADCDFWMRIGGAVRFRRIDEFLAIDRIHRHGLRNARASALKRELLEVRGRYVRTTGVSHSCREVCDRVVAGIGRRAQWIRLGMAATRRRPSGPWGQFLRDPAVGVSWRAILLGMVPGCGRVIGRAAIRRPSGWLMDEAPDH